MEKLEFQVYNNITKKFDLYHYRYSGKTLIFEGVTRNYKKMTTSMG